MLQLSAAVYELVRVLTNAELARCINSGKLAYDV